MGLTLDADRKTNYPPPVESLDTISFKLLEALTKIMAADGRIVCSSNPPGQKTAEENTPWEDPYAKAQDSLENSASKLNQVLASVPFDNGVMPASYDSPAPIRPPAKHAPQPPVYHPPDDTRYWRKQGLIN